MSREKSIFFILLTFFYFLNKIGLNLAPTRHRVEGHDMSKDKRIKRISCDIIPPLTLDRAVKKKVHPASPLSQLGSFSFFTLENNKMYKINGRIIGFVK